MENMLVIDDDETVRDVLRTVLSGQGFRVTLSNSGEEGIECLKSERFDLVLTDLVMPGAGGMDVLKEAASSKSPCPVIVMTAFGTVQTAVEAMRIGAFDYITKPFNIDELMIVVHKALAVSKLQQENVMLRMQLKRKYDFTGLIGDSAAMQAVYETIAKIADTESTVLISGDSGTGKELVAKIIHYNNTTRAQGPFVPINCGAIPRDLLESELFGHEKGAFTGATSMRMGRFELAHRGTLFLDEIGELDPVLQVKLLRVLQEREFQRVGGTKTIKIDVRILAATNRDLEQAVQAGRFREDLFYRLNVLPVHLPSLRERRQDIPLLVEYFLGEFAKKRRREPLRFSPEAMHRLMNYPWPGNVRELENLIERVSILVNGKTVQVSDLPEKIAGMPGPAVSTPDDARAAEGPSGPASAAVLLPEAGVSLNETVTKLERSLILQALRMTSGVRSRAAALLGLNRTTLLEKMKKLGITYQKGQEGTA